MTDLEQLLKSRIESGGPIPFAQFMEEALYGPGGYYRQPQTPIGPEGDFLTGSSHSPLFGATTARLLRRLDAHLGVAADYLEAGYGGGEHLGAVCAALAGGRERRIWAWDRVPRQVPPPAVALDRLDELAAGALTGLVFSYELFDALPVHRLVRRGDRLRELMVGVDTRGQLEWREGPLTDTRLGAWDGAELVDGQILDVTPAWRELYGELARRLGTGLLVTCDYGFYRRRLFDPRVRRHGTLACYRRHRVHRDPFTYVGRQDLTAHVDFTELVAAGEAAGLETVGLFRQAAWLAATGALEGAAERSPEERLAVLELMNLEGMGEEVRVLVQARGVDAGELVPDILE